VKLANRRFVAFYFDLSNRGFAGDPDAREFVVKKRKELGGRGVPTPPVLFMTPDGEVVGEVSNYASEKEVLAEMLDVLKDYPEYDKATEAEKNEKSPVARARILFELQELDIARKTLAREHGSEAQYLLGRIARFQHRFKSMDEHLAMVKDKDLEDDVRMEKAYRFWKGGEFEKLRDHLADFPRSSNRYTEARYYEGLAQFHLGRKDDALQTWKSTITSCSQDPWVYRADWAYTGLKQVGGRRMFSSGGAKTSLLNRIGYMGRRNPDLKSR
jgi:tetratricopeptide (TPR) repeat protein